MIRTCLLCLCVHMCVYLSVHKHLPMTLAWSLTFRLLSFLPLVTMVISSCCTPSWWVLYSHVTFTPPKENEGVRKETSYSYAVCTMLSPMNFRNIINAVKGILQPQMYQPCAAAYLCLMYQRLHLPQAAKNRTFSTPNSNKHRLSNCDAILTLSEIFQRRCSNVMLK